MNVEKMLKDVLWTEAEVGAMVVGAVASTKLLDERKIFKDDFAQHPEWFAGPRTNAPWYIKYAGGGKAIAAVFASHQIKEPWLKLLLYGVAIQGTIQEGRRITWNADANDYRYAGIQGGSKTATLDAKLKEMAQNYSATGTPRFVGGSQYGDRFKTNVAGKKGTGTPQFVGGSQYGNRFKTMVAGKNNKIFDSNSFSLDSSDDTFSA